MKVKNIVNNTANRGENSTQKWYGGFVYDDMETCRGKRKGTNTTYPNWKLVSRNKKQWMKKPIVITREKLRWNNRMYIDITW